MPAILFDLVQRLIGVLEDALAEVLAVGKDGRRATLVAADQFCQALNALRHFVGDVVAHILILAVADQLLGFAHLLGVRHGKVAVMQRDRDIKDTHALYSNFFQRQSGFPPEISTELQVILYIVYTSISKIPPHCNQIALGISSKIVQ